MRSLTDGSIEARSIKNYDFQFFRSVIRLKLMYLFTVSFLTTLTYIRLFKSHHTQIQRPRALFSLWELLCLYAIRFCYQVLPNLYCWWSEELCNQQHLFKLVELVMYWDPCKGLVANWKFVHQEKEGYYKIKSNWVLEQKFNCRLVFRDRLR